MKSSLNLKTNTLVILMTIFYFIIFIPVLMISGLGLLACYSIVFIIFRYIVLIRNFFTLFLNDNNNKNKKIMFYSNIINILICYYNIYFGLNFLPGLNVFLVYSEIFITAIFDIPVLYSLTKEITNNKLLKYIIRIILLWIAIRTLLLVNDKSIWEALIIP